MGESSFWYRPTRVVPDQRPLNGRCNLQMTTHYHIFRTANYDFLSQIWNLWLTFLYLVSLVFICYICHFMTVSSLTIYEHCCLRLLVSTRCSPQKNNADLACCNFCIHQPILIILSEVLLKEWGIKWKFGDLKKWWFYLFFNFIWLMSLHYLRKHKPSYQ